MGLAAIFSAIVILYGVILLVDPFFTLGFRGDKYKVELLTQLLGPNNFSIFMRIGAFIIIIIGIISIFIADHFI
jgi:hypothetical protein